MRKVVWINCQTCVEAVGTGTAVPQGRITRSNVDRNGLATVNDPPARPLKGGWGGIMVHPLIMGISGSDRNGDLADPVRSSEALRAGTGRGRSSPEG